MGNVTPLPIPSPEDLNQVAPMGADSAEIREFPEQASADDIRALYGYAKLLTVKVFHDQKFPRWNLDVNRDSRLITLRSKSGERGELTIGYPIDYPDSVDKPYALVHRGPLREVSETSYIRDQIRFSVDYRGRASQAVRESQDFQGFRPVGSPETQGSGPLRKKDAQALDEIFKEIIGIPKPGPERWYRRMMGRTAILKLFRRQTTADTSQQ